MTLLAGTRLGPFEILAPIGAGGMGEVYRARDSRLDRDLAIKVLPPDVADSPDRLRRFEKEAQAASALNHPNIVTVYDIGSADSVFYIAMELVAGKTLREMLVAGPLPVRKLLGIAPQIADGLARAHASGIVHRDLKPENVMVTGDGLVKILDFGLAKLVQSELEGGLPTQAPTVSEGTRPGVVLGTVGYMSPEQASGYPVDFQSDQFSFGSILYEMATGRAAFRRPTAAQTLAAIIEDEPEPIAAQNPGIPVPFRWTVERCLSKEPKDRYDSTRDLARDLARLRDGLSEGNLSGGVAAAAARPGILKRTLAASGLVLAGLGLIAGIRFALLPSAEPPRFQVLTFRRGLIPGARFSPDGQSVIYGAGWEGKPVELFSARPPSPDSRSLGLPPASILAISSTGEMALSVGCRFELHGRHSCVGTLARASLSGGASRDLLEKVHQADWSPDGKELAVVRQEEGGGTRLEFPIGHVLHKSSGWIGQPRFSPRGDAIAFFEKGRDATNGSISIADSRTGKVKSLSSGWEHCPGLAWSPAGDEVWFSGLRGSDLDPSALYAVSTSGRLRTVQRGAGALRLHDIAKDGRVLMTLDSIRAGLNGSFPGDTGEHDYSWFGFSVAKDLTPDGKFLLFGEHGPTHGEYFRKTDGSAAVSLGDAWTMTISPDARWIVTFTPAKEGLPHVALLPSGPGEPRNLPNSSLGNYEGAYWFPDSRRLSVEALEKGHRLRCYEQAIDGGEPRPVTPEGTHGCMVSPDARFLLTEDDQGKKVVYPVAGGEARPVPALAPDEDVLLWTSDSAGFFFRKRASRGKIERLDLASGRRQPALDLRPADPAGILGLDEIVMTPGGRYYAYSYRRVLSELYVVEGLR